MIKNWHPLCHTTAIAPCFARAFITQQKVGVRRPLLLHSVYYRSSPARQQPLRREARVPVRPSTAKRGLPGWQITLSRQAGAAAYTQDASVLRVENLLRCVDAHRCFELARLSCRINRSHGKRAAAALGHLDLPHDQLGGSPVSIRMGLFPTGTNIRLRSVWLSPARSRWTSTIAAGRIASTAQCSGRVPDDLRLVAARPRQAAPPGSMAICAAGFSEGSPHDPSVGLAVGDSRAATTNQVFPPRSAEE